MLVLDNVQRDACNPYRGTGEKAPIANIDADWDGVTGLEGVGGGWLNLKTPFKPIQSKSPIQTKKNRAAIGVRR